MTCSKIHPILKNNKEKYGNCGGAEQLKSCRAVCEKGLRGRAYAKENDDYFLLVALILSGLLSLYSMGNLQGNARVINYTGVVRGATQRLVKEELEGHRDDALISRLDGIIEELRTGKGRTVWSG